MDLLALLRLVAERWLVALPVLVLTAVVAVYVERQAPEAFEASGAVLVVESQVSPGDDPLALTDPTGLARWVRLSDEVRQLTAVEGTPEVIVNDATGDVTVEGPTAVTVAPVGDDGLLITVTGAPRDEMERAATMLADLVVGRVEQLQGRAGVPQAERIQATALQMDGVPTGDVDPGGEPAFTVTVDVLLDDPRGGAPNPFEAVPATARLLQVSSQSDAGRELVAERTQPDVSFEVSLDANDRAPILGVIVIGPSRGAAIEGFEEVVTFMGDDLEARQARAGVRSTERLELEVLAAPQTVRDASPPVSRTVVVLVALGGLFAVLAAMLAENISRRRVQNPRPPTEATTPEQDPVTVHLTPTRSNDAIDLPGELRTWPDRGSTLDRPEG